LGNMIRRKYQRRKNKKGTIGKNEMQETQRRRDTRGSHCWSRWAISKFGKKGGGNKKKDHGPGKEREEFTWGEGVKFSLTRTGKWGSLLKRGKKVGGVG